MGDRRLVQFVDGLTDNEKNMVRKVLNKYEFQIKDITKVRSAYKVLTNKGVVCLKKTKHGKNKARNANLLVEELFKNSFDNTAKYYKTKDNYLFVKHKKVLFYATQWIDGDECNFNDIEEAKDCMKLLAKFHIAANKIDTKKLKIKNNLKNWPKIYSRDLSDLEKYKRIISKKKLKSKFDITYSDFIDNYYNIGMLAFSLLNKSDYYKLSKQASDTKTICHDSFYYQNIIKTENKYFIIDLDSIIIDLHISDLGKLIRRLMFKKEYQWDFDKAKSLIEAYNSVNKLSKSELEAMLSLIVFPHKFWKLGKKRYLKHKSWSESKYMNKLNKLIRYNDLEQKFFENYIGYMEECSELYN